MAAVAFITASGGFGGNDLYWKNRLVNTHGDTVTGVEDSTAEATDFSSYDFIIIGYGVDPAQIGANMKAETIPMFTLRRTVDTELGCANSHGNTSSATVTVNIDTHYITNVFAAGVLTVYNSAQAVHYWSGTGNDMKDLVVRTGFPDRPCVGICEAGDTLNDGTSAAERRGIFGLMDDDDLHANALTIFDRMRSWMLYEDAVKIWLLNAVNSL